MRILAIRGSNIASLAGPFNVELDQEPLRGSGLFVITGPTGAGKSSLLDALCLALFDTTPRLRETTRVYVGGADEPSDQRLTGSDARLMLSRRAPRGHAEVDFEGIDGRRYRATWEVRRAHDRVDGRLQKPEMRLLDLETGRLIGDSRTEVKDAVAERLGVGFDQFRRSALLAQGDFAAFLSASQGERSELLERMTGTEIYGEISMAAHRRFVAERDEVARIDHRLEGTQALEPPVRAGRDAEYGKARARRAEAKARYDQIVAERDWATALETARAEFEEAENEAQALEDEWRVLDGAASEVRRVAMAQALRPIVADVDRTTQALNQAEDGLVQRSEEAQEQRRLLARCAEDLERAESALEQARARRAERQPALDRAAVLEAQHKELMERLARLDTERRALVDTRTALEHAAVTARADHERAANDSLEHETWLAAHAGDRALVENEGMLDALLEPLVSLDRRCRALDGQRQALDIDATALLARIAETETEIARLRQERERHASSLSRLSGEASEPAARMRLQEEMGHIERRLGDVDRLEALIEELRLERARLRIAEEQRGMTAESIRGLEVQLAEKTTALEQWKVRLQEASDAVTRARSAEDLEFHRRTLQPGDPCPLCGSEDHPWIDEVRSPFEGLLAELEGRAQSLEEERQVAEEARASAVAELGARQVEAERIVQEIENQTARVQALESRWASSFHLVPLLPPDPEGAAALLAERRRTARARAKTLDRTLKTFFQQEAALEAHGSALGTLDASIAGKESERATLVREREMLMERQADVDRDLGELKAALAMQQDTLASTFAGTTLRGFGGDDGALFDTLGLRAAFTLRMAEFKQRLVEAEVARAESARLDKALQEVSRRIQDMEERQARIEREHGETDALLAANREERTRLVGQETAAHVRARLDKALEDAEHFVDSARIRAAESENNATELGTRVAMLHDEVAIAITRRNAAHDTFAQELERGAWSEDEVRELLGRDRAWIDAQQVAHEAIKTRWNALQVRLSERRDRLAAVQQRGAQYAGVWDPARFQEAEREFEESTRRLAELGTLLKVDDAARARRDELLEERGVVMDRFERWSMLNDLIGSHDGRKLRVFAQSLTLDAVLAHANRHLSSLAPRYALMRVPGYDLELQIVDKDLGDEIRSVQTLSGGESFLVSLALALGLASLSTRGTHVGTLFIDEGFGSLDPDTLETAIYTLDRLRAEGRQIGIISHVENLAERIGSHVRITPRGGGQSMVVVCAA